MKWLPGGGILMVACLVAALAALAEGQMLEELVFSNDSSASLDLYLPEPGEQPPPLLIFVQSRFWGPGTHDRNLVQQLARPLQRAGVVVAIVRPRPASERPHPAAAEDVAAAIAYLIARDDEQEFDRRRIVLAGHASGAHLAALVALDPRYLSAHGLSPQSLRGVAAISGVYDLTSEAESSQAELELYQSVFGSESQRRDASPLHHANPTAPKLIALVAQQDAPEAREHATTFTKALRATGHPGAEALFIGSRDHWSQLDLTDEANPLRRHLLAMLEIDTTYGSIEDVLATRRFWHDPTLSTQGFWESGLEVESYQADERFLHTANLLFAKPGRPRLLTPSRYQAIDLLDFVARRAQETGQSGDYLTVRNARGEEMVWRISELRPFEPKIVIGLDDERELFRQTGVYHTLRRYTWKDPEPVPWVLARPLGAFVHFQVEPPPQLEPGRFARFALQPDAFSQSALDPLAPLRSLPEPQRELVIDELRCVSCHQLRGVGAKAWHLRATDASPVGGFALPLEEYPPEVWRRYCFEQLDVAAELGASPVPLDDRAGLLFQLVEAERGR